MSDQDLVSYIKSARRLSEILLVKGDYEGSLSIAIPAVEKMDEAGIGSDIDYAILLNTIGCCQLNLGHDEEAKESFITARERYVSRWESDSTSRGFQEAVVGTVYTSMAYINTRKYNEAIYWIDRSAMLRMNTGNDLMHVRSTSMNIKDVSKLCALWHVKDWVMRRKRPKPMKLS
jgi:hypothetical protein